MVAQRAARAARGPLRGLGLGWMRRSLSAESAPAAPNLDVSVKVWQNGCVVNYMEPPAPRPGVSPGASPGASPDWANASAEAVRAAALPRHLRPVPHRCAWCDARFTARPWGRSRPWSWDDPNPRPRDRYCSDSCRSSAYRWRQTVAAEEARIRDAGIMADRAMAAMAASGNRYAARAAMAAMAADEGDAE